MPEERKKTDEEIQPVDSVTEPEEDSDEAGMVEYIDIDEIEDAAWEEAEAVRAKLRELWKQRQAEADRANDSEDTDDQEEVAEIDPSAARKMEVVADFLASAFGEKASEHIDEAIDILLNDQAKPLPQADASITK